MALQDLREKLEDNQTMVLAVTGGLIVLCLIWIALALFGGGATTLPTQTTVIYYDVDQQTIRLVEHDMSKGPVSSPMSGSENIFVAAVWYCGEIRGVGLKDGMSRQELEGQGLFIAWLEKQDPAGTANDYITNPMLYRTLDNPTWHKSDTPGSLAIIESPLDRCDDPAQYVAD